MFQTFGLLEKSIGLISRGDDIMDRRQRKNRCKIIVYFTSVSFLNISVCFVTRESIRFVYFNAALFSLRLRFVYCKK